jgi:Uma2 family endonuclease
MALPVADIHRWSREEYERLVEIGVLGPEDKVELLDGIIYDMTPQDSWHASGVQAVNEALRSIFGEGYTIRVQMPLALGQSSEPEPDVAVVSGHWRDFRRSHPTAAVLVVEISGRSLFHDRERKQSLYALADIWRSAGWRSTAILRMGSISLEPSSSKGISSLPWPGQTFRSPFPSCSLDQEIP